MSALQDYLRGPIGELALVRVSITSGSVDSGGTWSHASRSSFSAWHQSEAASPGPPLRARNSSCARLQMQSCVTVALAGCDFSEDAAVEDADGEGFMVGPFGEL